jgi:hypothetical protein
MTKFALTEAYSEIYNSRNVEDIFDNLRFVDYMLAEDIEEVIEEMVWEFRDYGNTLDEAFELIDYALEDRVICESYDELINDILTEATVTRGRGRASITSSTDRPTTPGAGSSRISLGTGGSQRPSGSATVTSSNRFDQGEVARRAKRIGELRNAKRSVAARMSKLSGPISSVKQGISGAAGGMGRAAKALGSGVVERGKALLKGLLRRGGQAATATGRAIQSSGERAASAPATTRTANVGGRRVTVTTEPTPETGGKRRTLGRALRSIGAAMQRRAGRPESKMTRAKYDERKAQRQADAVAAVGNPFQSSTPQRTQTSPVRPSIGRVSGPASSPNRPSAPVQTGPVRPSIGRVQPGPASRSGETLKRQPTTPTSSERRYPTEPSGQTTLFTAPVKGRTSGADVKVPRGGQRQFGATRKPKATERTRQMPLRLKEDYELLTQYIAEDIVNAGYADDLYEAFDIIENLDQDTLAELVSDYLID